MNPHKPTVLDFFEFIYDRQKIWRDRKEGKTRPWTKDPILQKFCFCNVYRELDKCTVHLLSAIINNSKLSIQDKIFNIILYRRFNTPDFFDVFGVQNSNDFQWEKLIKCMDKRAEQGNNLFNSAYIISQTPYDREYGRREKHVQQILVMANLETFIDQLVENLQEVKTLEGAFNELKEIYGHGGFLAQQVLIDITYIKEFQKKWNINSFVDVGPGARPAAKMLMPDNTPVEACCCFYEVQGLMFSDLKEKRKKDWTKVYYRDSIVGGKYLRITDIQNCLCEFRKYCHLQTNPDKRKRYYKGGE